MMLSFYPDVESKIKHINILCYYVFRRFKLFKLGAFVCSTFKIPILEIKENDMQF